ncbi:methionyl-tRNA formyltransferase [Jejuia pallidilutea]|jgi:methionyl-tRNA formyltransferase|uniref:Methionyl-tRNA formyltransferase n=1 Tax=Jejuia pallidilutea TaxID=504487 RepID=A0A098LRA0_9FLAO|nr:formyltransferase family protein [Jejuia pallidilutea]GAL89430.1 methionyl-tRNA formyltransferase [Jejuia pallidilutea]
MGVTLFLMSYKGLTVLNALVKSSYKNTINAVIIGNDKSVVNDYSKDIEQLCKIEKLRFYYRADEYTVKSKYSIAVSWRWLIQLPENKKLIVLHDSLLPKYRGFAPLVNALKNGEKYLGVTALFASNEYDRGDIISQQKIEITYPITIADAIVKISALYQDIIFKIIKEVKNNNALVASPQDNSKASYSLWLDDEDYKIDWSKDSSYIERFVNATGYPYKGAQTNFHGLVITINSVEQINDVYIENRDVGKTIFLIEGKPVIVCGKGLLLIQEATYNKTKKSIFPLKSFRNRFS